MSKKRDRKNKIANTPSKPEHKRDTAIDYMGIAYDIDSDSIDELERQYAEKGEPLVSFSDYQFAFERRLLDNAGAMLDKARELLNRGGA